MKKIALLTFVLVTALSFSTFAKAKKKEEKKEDEAASRSGPMAKLESKQAALAPIEFIAPRPVFITCKPVGEEILLESAQKLNTLVFCSSPVDPSTLIDKCLCSLRTPRKIDVDQREEYQRRRLRYLMKVVDAAAKARVLEYSFAAFLNKGTKEGEAKDCPDFSKNKDFTKTITSAFGENIGNLFGGLAVPLDKNNVSSVRSVLEKDGANSDANANAPETPMFTEKDVNSFISSWSKFAVRIASKYRTKDELLPKIMEEIKAHSSTDPKDIYLRDLFLKPLTPGDKIPFIETIIEDLHNQHARKWVRKSFLGKGVELIANRVEKTVKTDESYVKEMVKAKLKTFLKDSCQKALGDTYERAAELQKVQVGLAAGSSMMGGLGAISSSINIETASATMAKNMLANPLDDINGNFLLDLGPVTTDFREQMYALHCEQIQNSMKGDPKYLTKIMETICGEDKNCLIIKNFLNAQFATIEVKTNSMNSTVTNNTSYDNLSKEVDEYIDNNYGKLKTLRPISTGNDVKIFGDENITRIQAPIATSTAEEANTLSQVPNSMMSNISAKNIVAPVAQEMSSALPNVVYQASTPQVLVTPAPQSLSASDKDNQKLFQAKSTDEDEDVDVKKKKSKKKSKKSKKEIAKEVVTEEDSADEEEDLSPPSAPISPPVMASPNKKMESSAMSSLPSNIKPPSFQEAKSNPSLISDNSLQKYAAARDFEQAIVVKNDSFSSGKNEGMSDMSPPETGLMLSAFKTGKISGKPVTKIVLGDEVKDVKSLEETNVFHGPVVIVEDKNKKERYICRAFVSDKDGSEKLLPINASSPGKDDLGGYKCTTEKKTDPNIKPTGLTEIQKKDAQKALTSNERMYKAFVLEKIISGSKK